jgi:hypothetical protein
MSQPSSEERRKFVLVFTGSAAGEKLETLRRFGEQVLGWQLKESHCIPLDTPVRVGDEAKK